MPLNETEEQNRIQKLPRPAAVERTLAIFSDFWAFAVLQELFFGVRRFDDFQQNLNISRSVLTRRLRHLEEQLIIERKLYTTRPNRYEYKLTKRGRDMYPIFVALRQWGERWLDDARTDELQLIHKRCDKELNLKLICGECNEEVNANEIHYKMRPFGEKPQ